jgi:hypothetical protein
MQRASQDSFSAIMATPGGADPSPTEGLAGVIIDGAAIADRGVAAALVEKELTGARTKKPARTGIRPPNLEDRVPSPASICTLLERG